MPYRGHRRRAASSALSLAALYARQRPLYPRRVYRHERDGGDHRFSRYSESGEAEYKWPMLQQVLQPAAYLERELRRIVCWLLILSAEI